MLQRKPSIAPKTWRQNEKKRNYGCASSVNNGGRGPVHRTYMQLLMGHREEFQEFKEFINKVKPVHVRVNTEDPQEVADFERLLASNPCVETFSVGSDEEVAVFYNLQLRFNRYPEWREELADYRDIIREYSPQELDEMQLEARAKLANKHIILARGEKFTVTIGQLSQTTRVHGALASLNVEWRGRCGTDASGDRAVVPSHGYDHSAVGGGDAKGGATGDDVGAARPPSLPPVPTRHCFVPPRRRQRRQLPTRQGRQRCQHGAITAVLIVATGGTPVQALRYSSLTRGVTEIDAQTAAAAAAAASAAGGVSVGNSEADPSSVLLADAIASDKHGANAS
ncbi:hypothetical protein B0H11DRAFT_1939127 [Mycena galericulata]|nr:hypothetical protein B0H11DRAFT_1939127 [Mycena galericulata]